MKVLLVDSCPTTVKAVSLMLAHAGMNVYECDTVADAKAMIQDYVFDFVVTEFILPDGGVSDLLKAAKTIKPALPVLVLSGHDAMPNKLHAFACDADDFLPKPFHREELIARIKAIHYRYTDKPQPWVFRAGPFVVDTIEHTVQWQNKTLRLRGMQHKVFAELARQIDTPVLVTDLMTVLYGNEQPASSKVLLVYVSNLRQNLAAVGFPPHIVTTPAGYMLSSTPVTIDKLEET